MTGIALFIAVVCLAILVAAVLTFFVRFWR